MISVSIPTYYTDETGDKIIEGLEFSFGKLFIQDYKDFEVVISDHSIGDRIEELCNQWKNKLDVKYFKNENNRGFLNANNNFGIRHCSGDIIKFLDQDDYMLNEHSLGDTVKYFEDQYGWMATAYYHTHDRVRLENVHFPAVHVQLHIVNTIGTPSCVSIRNKDVIYFDETLKYYGDCEYYKRLYDKFGMPKLANYMTVVQYLWEGQSGHLYENDAELQDREVKYILERHGEYLNGVHY